MNRPEPIMCNSPGCEGREWCGGPGFSQCYYDECTCRHERGRHTPTCQVNMWIPGKPSLLGGICNIQTPCKCQEFRDRDG